MRSRVVPLSFFKSIRDCRVNMKALLGNIIFGYLHGINIEWLQDWFAQFGEMKIDKFCATHISKKIVDVTTVDFMFKMNFLMLLTNTLAKNETKNRLLSFDLLKRVQEDTPVQSIDWCGYILDSLKDSKVLDVVGHFYNVPLLFLTKHMELEIEQVIFGDLEFQGEWTQEEARLTGDFLSFRYPHNDLSRLSYELAPTDQERYVNIFKGIKVQKDDDNDSDGDIGVDDGYGKEGDECEDDSGCENDSSNKDKDVEDSHSQDDVNDKDEDAEGSGGDEHTDGFGGERDVKGSGDKDGVSEGEDGSEGKYSGADVFGDDDSSDGHGKDGNVTIIEESHGSDGVDNEDNTTKEKDHNLQIHNASPKPPAKRHVKPSVYMYYPYINKKTLIETLLTHVEYKVSNYLLSMMGGNGFSSAKATDQTECHKCGKKGHFARDCWSKTSVPSYQSHFQSKSLSSPQHKPKLRPTKDFEAKYNKVKAKLALLSLSASDSKALTVKNKADDTKVSIPGVERLWLSEVEGFILPNHDTGRILPAESQRNTNDPSVAVIDSSATDYDSADESSVCSTPLPPLKKLDGAEPIFGPKTIKSILRSKFTFKAKTLKGIIINEPSLTLAKDNKSSLALKVNSAPVGKLKSVKIEDDPPLAIVMKELNNLKLQLSKSHHLTLEVINHYSISKVWIDLHQDLKSQDHQNASFHLVHTVEDYLSRKKDQSKKSSICIQRCEACGSSTHTITDHYDIKWFKRGEALLAKKAEALKSTRAKSSNANRYKTPAKSGCSRHMTGVKSYLHKYMEQPGSKVVFGDDSTCTTEGYGSIKCNGIVFTKVAFVDSLKYNLISISQLCDAKYIVQFDEKRGTIFKSNKEVVMIAPRVRDVYVLDMTSSAQESCFFAKASENLSWLWHKRLAHLNFKTINKLAKQNLIIGLLSLVYLKDKSCSSCEKGKHHRASFKTKQTSSIKKCLHLLHMDLIGLVTPNENSNGTFSNLGPDLSGKAINETLYGDIKQILRNPTLLLLREFSDSDYAGCNMDKKAPQVPIFCDNTSAIAISDNPILHLGTKHIDIRYHFMRDHILKGDIELHFIPTQYQLANIFTEPLDEPTFKRLIVELETETKSSSTKDKSPSHPSPPVVGEMHKVAQQVAGGPTSLGATSEEGPHPQLSSGSNLSVLVDKTKSLRDGLKTTHTDSGTNKESRADDISKKIKLENLSEFLKDTRSAFFTPDFLQDEPIIVTDKSEEEDADKEETHNTSHDIPEEIHRQPAYYSLITFLKPELSKLLASHNFASCLPTELKELLSKFTKLSGEIKALKQDVKDTEIKLHRDLKKIPTKLETFTFTISSLTSQVIELKNIQWELPTELHALTLLVSLVQNQLKTLDFLPSLLHKVTETLNRFATVVENASEATTKDVPLAGQATASPAEGEKNTKDAETNFKDKLIDLLGTNVVTRDYNKKLLFDKYCDKMMKRKKIPKITNCEVLIKKGPITLKIYREDGSKEVISNLKVRFPAQSNSSSNAIALDSPYLIVLNTEASQSRQHGKE
nr:retrovirus-related Pol polyprotein from transposon TNT 1-94 [Tanacetum cinerariifolium]